MLVGKQREASCVNATLSVKYVVTGGMGNCKSSRVTARRVELDKLIGKYAARTSVKFKILKKPSCRKQEWVLKRDDVIARLDLPRFK